MNSKKSVPPHSPFSFGRSRLCYERGEHPRLLCDIDSLSVLREKIRSGRGMKLMSALRANTALLAKAVNASGENLAEMLARPKLHKSLMGTRILQALPDMALVAALDENTAMVRAVCRILETIPAAEARQDRGRLRLGWSGSQGGIGIALAYDMAFGFLSREQRAAYTEWSLASAIRENLDKLRAAHFLRASAANIPLGGLASALTNLLAIEGDPGVPGLEPEKRELLRYLEAALQTVVGPSGYPTEDTGYGTLVAGRMECLAETVRRAGLLDHHVQFPGFMNYGRAMLHFVQPWGQFLVNTGDHCADMGMRNLILLRQAAVGGDPVLLWLLSTLTYPIGTTNPGQFAIEQSMFPEVELGGGLKVPADAYSLLAIDDWDRPVPPWKKSRPTQFMDSGRGIVSFRSSWKPDATLVILDGSHRSPVCAGHEHDSGGHFILSALGEYFAVHGGRYNMEQDQHNVVLVNGRSGHDTRGQWVHSSRRAHLTSYQPGKWIDTASVDYSQMSDCFWARRTLGLVKETARVKAPAYVWTVEDINKNNQLVDLSWTLQAHPDHQIRLTKNRATIIGSDHGNQLDVFIVRPDGKTTAAHPAVEFSTDVRLAGSYAYLKDREARDREYRRQVGNPAYGPVFRHPRLVAKVSQSLSCFMALMVPRLRGERPAKVETLPTLDHAIAARISFGDVQDVFIWANTHYLLEAADIRARGQWCLVRRSLKTGRVIACHVEQGSHLSIAGKTWVLLQRANPTNPHPAGLGLLQT